MANKLCRVTDFEKQAVTPLAKQISDIILKRVEADKALLSFNGFFKYLMENNQKHDDSALRKILVNAAAVYIYLASQPRVRNNQQLNFDPGTAQIVYYSLNTEEYSDNDFLGALSQMILQKPYFKNKKDALEEVISQMEKLPDDIKTSVDRQKFYTGLTKQFISGLIQYIANNGEITTQDQIFQAYNTLKSRFLENIEDRDLIAYIDTMLPQYSDQTPEFNIGNILATRALNKSGIVTPYLNSQKVLETIGEELYYGVSKNNELFVLTKSEQEGVYNIIGSSNPALSGVIDSSRLLNINKASTQGLNNKQSDFVFGSGMLSGGFSFVPVNNTRPGVLYEETVSNDLFELVPVRVNFLDRTNSLKQTNFYPKKGESFENSKQAAELSMIPNHSVLNYGFEAQPSVLFFLVHKTSGQAYELKSPKSLAFIDSHNNIISVKENDVLEGLGLRGLKKVYRKGEYEFKSLNSEDRKELYNSFLAHQELENLYNDPNFRGDISDYFFERFNLVKDSSKEEVIDLDEYIQDKPEFMFNLKTVSLNDRQYDYFILGRTIPDFKEEDEINSFTVEEKQVPVVVYADKQLGMAPMFYINSSLGKNEVAYFKDPSTGEVKLVLLQDLFSKRLEQLGKTLNFDQIILYNDSPGITYNTPEEFQKNNIAYRNLLKKRATEDPVIFSAFISKLINLDAATSDKPVLTGTEANALLSKEYADFFNINFIRAHNLPEIYMNISLNLLKKEGTRLEIQFRMARQYGDQELVKQLNETRKRQFTFQFSNSLMEKAKQVFSVNEIIKFLNENGNKELAALIKLETEDITSTEDQLLKAVSLLDENSTNIAAEKYLQKIKRVELELGEFMYQTFLKFKDRATNTSTGILSKAQFDIIYPNEHTAYTYAVMSDTKILHFPKIHPKQKTGLKNAFYSNLKNYMIVDKASKTALHAMNRMNAFAAGDNINFVEPTAKAPEIQVPEETSYTVVEPTKEVPAAVKPVILPKKKKFSIVKDESLEFETVEERKESIRLIHNILPQFGIDEVYNLSELLELSLENETVLGFFSDKVITLNGSIRGKGVVYHEAFHGVFRHLMTKTDRTKLLDSVKKLKEYKDLFTAESLRAFAKKRQESNLSLTELADLQAEEILADEFRDHIIDNKKPRNIFQKIFKFLKDLIAHFTNTRFQYYEKIAKGGYSAAEISSGLYDGKVAYKLIRTGPKLVASEEQEGLVPDDQTLSIDEQNQIVYRLTNRIMKDEDGKLSFRQKFDKARLALADEYDVEILKLKYPDKAQNIEQYKGVSFRKIHYVLTAGTIKQKQNFINTVDSADSNISYLDSFEQEEITTLQEEILTDLRKEVEALKKSFTVEQETIEDIEESVYKEESSDEITEEVNNSESEETADTRDTFDSKFTHVDVLNGMSTEFKKFFSLYEYDFYDPLVDITYKRIINGEMVFNAFLKMASFSEPDTIIRDIYFKIQALKEDGYTSEYNELNAAFQEFIKIIQGTNNVNFDNFNIVKNRKLFNEFVELMDVYELENYQISFTQYEVYDENTLKSSIIKKARLKESIKEQDARSKKEDIINTFRLSILKLKSMSESEKREMSYKYKDLQTLVRKIISSSEASPIIGGSISVSDAQLDTFVNELHNNLNDIGLKFPKSLIRLSVMGIDINNNKKAFNMNSASYANYEANQIFVINEHILTKQFFRELSEILPQIQSSIDGTSDFNLDRYFTKTIGKANKREKRKSFDIAINNAAIYVASIDPSYLRSMSLNAEGKLTYRYVKHTPITIMVKQIRKLGLDNYLNNLPKYEEFLKNWFETNPFLMKHFNGTIEQKTEVKEFLKEMGIYINGGVVTNTKSEFKGQTFGHLNNKNFYLQELELFLQRRIHRYSFYDEAGNSVQREMVLFLKHHVLNEGSNTQYLMDARYDRMVNPSTDGYAKQNVILESGVTKAVNHHVAEIYKSMQQEYERIRREFLPETRLQRLVEDQLVIGYNAIEVKLEDGKKIVVTDSINQKGELVENETVTKKGRAFKFIKFDNWLTQGDVDAIKRDPKINPLRKKSLIEGIELERLLIKNAQENKAISDVLALRLLKYITFHSEVLYTSHIQNLDKEGIVRINPDIKELDTINLLTKDTSGGFNVKSKIDHNLALDPSLNLKTRYHGIEEPSIEKGGRSIDVSTEYGGKAISSGFLDDPNKIRDIAKIISRSLNIDQTVDQIANTYQITLIPEEFADDVNGILVPKRNLEEITKILRQNYLLKSGDIGLLMRDKFFNTLVSNLQINELLDGGDRALYVNDSIDFVKRNKQNIISYNRGKRGYSTHALIQSVQLFMNTSYPELGQFDNLNDVREYLEENFPSQIEELLAGFKAIDVADGQTFATLMHHIELLDQFGRVDEDSEKILIAANFRELTPSEISRLESLRIVLNSKKTAYGDSFTYLKHAEHIILRSDVSMLKPGLDPKIAYKTLQSIYTTIYELRQNKHELYESLLKKGEVSKFENHPELSRMNSEIAMLYADVHNKYFIPIPGKEVLHNMLNAMELENIDTVSDTNASKRGKLNVNTVDFTSPILGQAFNTKINLSNRFKVSQIETSGIKEKSKASVQSKLLIAADFEYLKEQLIEEYGEIAGEREYEKLRVLFDDYQNTLADVISTRHDLFKDVILGKNEDGTIEFDIASVYNIIRESLIERKANPNVIKMFDLENGEVVHSQYSPMIQETINYYFYSTVSSYLTVEEVSGQKTIHNSSFGRKVTYANEDVEVIVDTDEDGNNITETIYAGTIITPDMYKEFPELIGFYQSGLIKQRHLGVSVEEDENGDRIYYVEALIAKPLFNSIEEEDFWMENVSKFFATRIPTEDKRSMLAVKVVGFLDPSYRNSIIVPHIAHLLAGSDFDIDSLYMHSKAYYKDFNGDYKLYGDAQTKSEHIVEFYNSLFAKKDFKSLMKAKMKTSYLNRWLVLNNEIDLDKFEFSDVTLDVVSAFVGYENMKYLSKDNIKSYIATIQRIEKMWEDRDIYEKPSYIESLNIVKTFQEYFDRDEVEEFRRLYPNVNIPEEYEQRAKFGKALATSKKKIKKLERSFEQQRVNTENIIVLAMQIDIINDILADKGIDIDGLIDEVEKYIVPAKQNKNLDAKLGIITNEHVFNNLYRKENADPEAMMNIANNNLQRTESEISKVDNMDTIDGLINTRYRNKQADSGIGMTASMNKFLAFASQHDLRLKKENTIWTITVDGKDVVLNNYNNYLFHRPISTLGKAIGMFTDALKKPLPSQLMLNDINTPITNNLLALGMPIQMAIFINLVPEIRTVVEQALEAKMENKRFNLSSNLQLVMKKIEAEYNAEQFDEDGNVIENALYKSLYSAGVIRDGKIKSGNYKLNFSELDSNGDDIIVEDYFNPSLEDLGISITDLSGRPFDPIIQKYILLDLYSKEAANGFNITRVGSIFDMFKRLRPESTRMDKILKELNDLKNNESIFENSADIFYEGSVAQSLLETATTIDALSKQTLTSKNKFMVTLLETINSSTISQELASKILSSIAVMHFKNSDELNQFPDLKKQLLYITDTIDPWFAVQNNMIEEDLNYLRQMHPNNPFVKALIIEKNDTLPRVMIGKKPATVLEAEAHALRHVRLSNKIKINNSGSLTDVANGFEELYFGDDKSRAIATRLAFLEIARSGFSKIRNSYIEFINPDISIMRILSNSVKDFMKMVENFSESSESYQTKLEQFKKFFNITEEQELKDLVNYWRDISYYYVFNDGQRVNSIHPASTFNISALASKGIVQDDLKIQVSDLFYEMVPDLDFNPSKYSKVDKVSSIFSSSNLEKFKMRYRIDLDINKGKGALSKLNADGLQMIANDIRATVVKSKDGQIQGLKFAPILDLRDYDEMTGLKSMNTKGLDVKFLVLKSLNNVPIEQLIVESMLQGTDASYMTAWTAEYEPYVPFTLPSGFAFGAMKSDVLRDISLINSKLEIQIGNSSDSLENYKCK